MPTTSTKPNSSPFPVFLYLSDEIEMDCIPRNIRI